MIKNGFLFLVVLAIFAGCTETAEIGPADAGKEYYPLQIGSSRTYRVMEKHYLQNEVTDSTVFYLKERVDTMYTNIAGETSYKIIRARKRFISDVWLDDSVITVTVTPKELRRQEHNMTFLKMVFPVKEGKSWSQNLYNELEFDTVLVQQNQPQNKPRNTAYVNIGQPFQVLDKNFPNTIMALTVREEGNIFVNFRQEEVYAENIGLVYRNNVVLEYCNIEACTPKNDPEWIPSQFTLRGYIRLEELIENEN